MSGNGTYGGVLKYWTGSSWQECPSTRFKYYKSGSWTVCASSKFHIYKSGAWYDIRMSGPTPRTNLSGYWKLDETSGSAADSTANGNTLSVYNASENNSGKIGTCYGFNGTTSYITPTPDSSLFAYTNNISASYWFKTKVNLVDMITMCNWDWATGSGWIFYIGSDNAIAFEAHDPAQTPTNAQAQVYGISSSDGNWHNVVGTFDGNYAKLYVDGTLQSTSTLWGHNIAYTSSNRFRIGADNGNATNFNGYLDEIGVWNRALTQADVTWLYNTGTGRTYPFK